MRLLFLSLLLLCSVSTSFGEIYQCEDRNGEMHFNDSLPYSNMDDCTFSKKDLAKLKKMEADSKTREKRKNKRKIIKVCTDNCKSIERKGVVINMEKCVQNCYEDWP